MRKPSLILGSALLLILAGCSEQSGPAEKKEPPKPVEPVSGQTALFRMYQVARSWAPDTQVLKMNSIHLLEVPSVPGQAGAWEATFTSPARGAQKTYTYSVIESPGNLHQGVFAGPEEDLSAQAQPFLIAAVKVDTDAAYKTALAKAAEYDKKNPNLTISMLLEKNKQYPNPAWRMIWVNPWGLPVCRCSSTRPRASFWKRCTDGANWRGRYPARRARKPSGGRTARAVRSRKRPIPAVARAGLERSLLRGDGPHRLVDPREGDVAPCLIAIDTYRVPILYST